MKRERKCVEIVIYKLLNQYPFVFADYDIVVYAKFVFCPMFGIYLAAQYHFSM